MNLRIARICSALIVLQCSIYAQAAKSVPKYGSNPAAGQTFTHDGVKLYYEVYGSGQPLLIIHPNGGSIAYMRKQIDYFRTRYKVIAMDCRDQGKSADSPDKITYEKMSEDLAALLDHLKVGPVYVLGWSDGAINALFLGMRHPEKVKKIAAASANLNPSDKALHPDTVAFIKAAVAAPSSPREHKVTQMMLEEPNIDLKQLESIAAPTLILASDHDVIADEHTLEIYHHIPNSQLCIFPGATHAMPFDDPARFNSTVQRFFSTAFVKKDRIKDMEKSFAAIQAGR